MAAAPRQEHVLKDNGRDARNTALPVRDVFAHNLQRLSERARSVSALCRDLGINRTQFNRYLSGHAYPRPEVLARICAHFDVDARILLQPLPDNRSAGFGALMRRVDLSAFDALQRVDHARVPDGIYRYTSMNAGPGQSEAFIDLYHLFTLPGGAKTMLFAVPRRYAAMVNGSMRWRDRKVSGLVSAHADGFSLAQASHYSSLLILSFFSNSYQGADGVHAGFTAATQVKRTGQRQVWPAMLERVGGGFAAKLAARRSCGYVAARTLPDYQREYFADWTPG